MSITHRDCLISELNRLAALFNDPRVPADLGTQLHEALRRARAYASLIEPVANPALCTDEDVEEVYEARGPVAGLVMERCRTERRLPTPLEMARETQRRWGCEWQAKYDARKLLTCRIHPGAEIDEVDGTLQCEHGCAANNVVRRET